MQDCKQITLFSKSRLEGYASLSEHENNLYLIGSISRKIGILEIVIRNKIDALICEIDDQWEDRWRRYLGKKIDSSSWSRDVFISSQNLGFWVKMADFYELHKQIFHQAFLDSLELKKYFEKNPRKFRKQESTQSQKSHDSNITRYYKGQAILKLFHSLRNRAFHFENLYKMNEKGPRLSITIINKNNARAIVSIHPDKIELFLNDLLESFETRLASYANRKI